MSLNSPDHDLVFEHGQFIAPLPVLLHHRMDFRHGGMPVVQRPCLQCFHNNDEAVAAHLQALLLGTVSQKPRERLRDVKSSQLANALPGHVLKYFMSDLQ